MENDHNVSRVIFATALSNSIESDIIRSVCTVLIYTFLRPQCVQYKWHVFVRRDIENAAFTITAVPAVVDSHLLVMEKSWKN